MGGCLESDSSFIECAALCTHPEWQTHERAQCMNHRTLKIIISVVAICVIALCMSLAPRKVSAQNVPSPPDEKEPVVPVYNPYPTGILPGDLNSELARVEREVDVLEGRALAPVPNFPPLKVTNQPPVFQGS